ncbi:MAG TPA: peptide chain release factor N(5)-glutamine methyltransferase [Candidatus Kapabacteria bacterium]|nr:peptide chain release factor N(5)-glutamine methyltransferase [Candidatus Kapabacteria bacterium]
MQTVAQALQWAVEELSAVSPADDAQLDAEWLLGHLLGKNRAWLRAFAEQVLAEADVQQYCGWIARRRAGEPVAYIGGCQGFWSFELEVTADTLVPRPDTELLVETALELLDASAKNVVDLGTGTGAIALALKSERPEWQVLATDIDAASLALAQRNAQRLGLAIDVRESCWLRDLGAEKFQLIVSNPPYIRADDPHLAGAGVRFEPLRALVSGVDGLDAIREIVATAPDHLHAGGWLLLEHGYDQGAAVRGLLQARGFHDVETRRDLGGNERVTLGRWF